MFLVIRGNKGFYQGVGGGHSTSLPLSMRDILALEEGSLADIFNYPDSDDLDVLSDYYDYNINSSSSFNITGASDAWDVISLVFCNHAYFLNTTANLIEVTPLDVTITTCQYYVMKENYVNYNSYASEDAVLRPVVCLKPTVQIVKSEEGKFSI